MTGLLESMRAWLRRRRSAAAAEQAHGFWSQAEATTIAGSDYYEIARRALQEDVLPLLSGDERVLDFGCGDGDYTLPLARAVAHVDGIDVSPSLVRQARARAAEAGVQNVAFDVGSQVPEGRTGHYDLVCAMGVLVCLVDDHTFAATLDRLGRSVRAGGYLLLRETTSGLGRVVWRREDYVACYRPRSSTLQPLEGLGFELVLDRKLAVWSVKEERSNHLWLLRRSGAVPTD